MRKHPPSTLGFFDEDRGGVHYWDAGALRAGDVSRGEARRPVARQTSCGVLEKLSQAALAAGRSDSVPSPSHLPPSPRLPPSIEKDGRIALPLLPTQSSQEINELLEKHGAADISSQDSTEQPLSNEVQHLNSPCDRIGTGTKTSVKIKA